MGTSAPGILLEVEKLEVVYNWVALAIQGVSFKVRNGENVLILGVNGAGKSTTLRAISGFLRTERIQISDGSIHYKGELLNNKPPHEIAKRGISLVPEREKIFVTLTVEENLLAASSVLGNKEGLNVVYGYFPILRERRKQMAGYLSGGERQMLAIGMALMCSPKLLLVDELSLGLAPVVVKHIMEILRRLKDELNFSILLVEQNAQAGLEISDYGYIMEGGRIVFEGSREKLLSHEDVKEFYLGRTAERKSYRDVKQYRRIRKWWS